MRGLSRNQAPQPLPPEASGLDWADEALERLQIDLQAHQAGLEQGALIDETEFQKSMEPVLMEHLYNTQYAAQRHGVSLTDAQNEALVSVYVRASQSQRVRELVTRTVRNTGHEKANLDVFNVDPKLRDLHTQLDSVSRSELGATLAKEAVKAIDRHKEAADRAQITKAAYKIDRYLDLADIVAPPATLNPLQVQTRQAARMVGQIMKGVGSTQHDINALTQHAERLAKVSTIRDDHSVPLPAEDIETQQKLLKALESFKVVGHPQDTETIKQIQKALIKFDTPPQTPDLTTTKSVTAKTTPRPGDAADISRITVGSTPVKVVSGDKDVYTFWNSRIAKSVGTGAIAAGFLASTALPAAATSPAANASSSPRQINTLQVSSLAAPVNQNLAPQALTQLDLAPAADTSVSTEQTIAPTPLAVQQPSNVSGHLETTQISPITPVGSVSPVAKQNNQPVAPAASLHQPNNAPAITMLDTAPVAPAAKPKTAAEPLQVISNIQLSPADATPTAPLAPMAPTTVKHVTGNLVLATDETDTPVPANSPTLTTVTADTTQNFNVQNNTPTDAALSSAQEILSNTIGSGATIDSVASAMRTVLQNQAAANGNTLTAHPDLAALRASTLQAAELINPTSDTAMRRAAFAVVLSENPELLADPATNKQIQDSFDTSDSIFTTAYMKWLNNQPEAPANVANNTAIGSTDQIIDITKLLASAKVADMTPAQQQAWLDKYDLAAAVQYRSKKVAAVTLSHATQDPKSTAPKAPAKPAAAPKHATPPPVAKKPASHNVAPAANVSLQRLLAYGVPAQYANLYVKYGNQYAVAPEFLAAQGKEESGYQPDVVSSAGAQGIAQFMPKTWQGWVKQLGFPADASPFNPEYAIQAQAAMMKGLIDASKPYANSTHSAEAIALAGYNLGFGAVQKAHGMPPNIRNYSTNILDIEAKIRAYKVAQAVNPAPAQPGSPSTRVERDAAKLLSEQNTALNGSNQVVFSDLTTIEQGNTINNQKDTKGRPTSLDPQLLEMDQKLIDEGWDLQLWNMVTGHGWDKHEHPRGKAEDLGSVHNRITGESTNFTPGTSGFNLSVAIKFREALSRAAPSGSWLGQGDYPAYGSEHLASDTSTGPDSWNHQHLELYDPDNPNG